MNVIYDIGRTLSDGTWALLVIPGLAFLGLKQLSRNSI